MSSAAPIKVVYFGTPAFAVPALEAFAADPRFSVELVVTQPDRPAGRGRKVERSAVGEAATALGLPLYQPASLRTPELRQPLVEAEADLFIVAAFGLVFGPKTLAIPRRGCINIHGSLLPRFRGASPVQCAVLAGDATSGVTIMLMDVGLDTGDVLLRVPIALAADETSASLMGKLALLGAQSAPDAAARFCANVLTPHPQGEVGISTTRLITKADGWLDWQRPAVDLERQVRALWPWPRAWTTVGEHVIQVHQASVGHHEERGLPGSARLEGQAVLVQCNPGVLRLERVQPAGKTAMDGAAFARGLPAPIVFGVTGNPGPQPPVWQSMELRSTTGDGH